MAVPLEGYRSTPTIWNSTVPGDNRSTAIWKTHLRRSGFHSTSSFEDASTATRAQMVNTTACRSSLKRTVSWNLDVVLTEQEPVGSADTAHSASLSYAGKAYMLDFRVLKVQNMSFGRQCLLMAGSWSSGTGDEDSIQGLRKLLIILLYPGASGGRAFTRHSILIYGAGVPLQWGDMQGCMECDCSLGTISAMNQARNWDRCLRSRMTFSTVIESLPPCSRTGTNH
ncbi:hypothetical protein EDC04DRAFT_1357069 [Pisolithus marmoratus]|nr:hypothetical protein EDC04DRAFT_1357069 [Pisolithus marmoratus]